MKSMQLEFNFESAGETDTRLTQMQKQIDDACESMGKVRRKLFSQMGELKKEMAALQIENEMLKEKIRNITNEKIEWEYEKEDCLFDIAAPKVAFG